MKFLVTGCYGFIGFNFINNLLLNHDDNLLIYGIDSLESSCSIKNKNLQVNNKNFIFFESNINQIDSLNLNNIDTLVNFAAESHVDNSIYNPELFIDTNVKGTTKLLKFAIENNIENFIHVSTDEVYGSKQEGFCIENDIFNPSSPYSASKASAELIINSFKKTYNYEVKIVRPANNYGIYQQPEKLIPYSIAKLEKNEKIEIYGEGKNIRHWLNVNDTCSAIMTVLENGKKGEVYNIGSDFYLQNIEVAHKLLEILDLSNDMIDFVDDRPGHDFRYAINSEKLKSLGWTPKANFDDELEKIVDWYIKNKDWWQEEFSNIISNKRKNRMGLV